MLWLTTFRNPRPVAVEYHALDAVWLTLSTVALLAAALLLSKIRTSAPVAVSSSSPGVILTKTPVVPVAAAHPT
jgi:hypothetical protein